MKACLNFRLFGGSCRDHFMTPVYLARRGQKCRIMVGISMLSVVCLGDISTSGFGGHIAISGYRSLWRALLNIFELSRLLRFALGIWTLFQLVCYSFSDICSPFPISSAISGADGWWNALLEFRRYLPHFWGDKYFRFEWPYCYFRSSFVVEIAVFELAMVDSPRFRFKNNI